MPGSLAPLAGAWTLASSPGGGLGAALPAWSALPFAGILLSIALLPLAAPHFWRRHHPKVALGWAAVLAVPFVAAYRADAVGEILHTAVAEYLPFVILLGALFTIGGGIYVRGTLGGTPAANTAMLAFGAAIASWVGTTGAAMLLVRPLLRANASRRHRAHTVVFFIVLVANVGGALTPLGDPPLFLGFLAGVPFFWTLSLAAETATVAAFLLAIYLALDVRYARAERRPRPIFGPEPAPAAAPAPREPLRVEGAHNLLLLAGVLAAVVLSGSWQPGEVSVLGIRLGAQNLVRDVALLALAALSWWTTPRRLREANSFSWEPIREVAILFAAIFVTIIPALAILRAGELGAMAPLLRAVRRPAHFFWAAGLLSSLLDNAPTYLAFLSTALGRFQPGAADRQAVAALAASHAPYLQAIATGAVFMGANTYLGNAPNFMVRSIAEEMGVEMPSFFGYILRYTLPFLVPVFLLATWLFF
jgi:Na+/H+ antiporter NhaD/arsenite permease-like protein